MRKSVLHKSWSDVVLSVPGKPSDCRAELETATLEVLGNGDRVIDADSPQWKALVDRCGGVPRAARMAHYGPPLWAQLHGRVLGGRDRTPAARLQFLAGFERLIPCGECLGHWKAMLARNPPVVNTPESFFAWTVDRHNEVNRRLGKPEMNLIAAGLRWVNVE